MSWPENVTKADLRIEYFRGSGAGGQHRNKRDTACRMTHIPTGKVATAQENKSKERNKVAAFRRLAAILVPMMRAALEPGDEHKAVSKHVIRTYNAQRHTVKNHLSGVVAPYERVLNGELELIQ